MSAMASYSGAPNSGLYQSSLQGSTSGGRVPAPSFDPNYYGAAGKSKPQLESNLANLSRIVSDLWVDYYGTNDANLRSQINETINIWLAKVLENDTAKNAVAPTPAPAVSTPSTPSVNTQAAIVAYSLSNKPADWVKLGTNEYVDSKVFYAISEAEKDYLFDNGVAKFNSWRSGGGVQTPATPTPTTPTPTPTVNPIPALQVNEAIAHNVYDGQYNQWYANRNGANAAIYKKAADDAYAAWKVLEAQLASAGGASTYVSSTATAPLPTITTTTPATPATTKIPVPTTTAGKDAQLVEVKALQAKRDAAKSNYETGLAYIKAVAASGNVYAGNIIGQKQPEVDAYKAQLDAANAELAKYDVDALIGSIQVTTPSTPSTPTPATPTPTTQPSTSPVPKVSLSKVSTESDWEYSQRQLKAIMQSEVDYNQKNKTSYKTVGYNPTYGTYYDMSKSSVPDTGLTRQSTDPSTIPADAIITSRTPQTGLVKDAQGNLSVGIVGYSVAYIVPDKRTAFDRFTEMVNGGQIPKGSTFIKAGDDGGIQYLPPVASTGVAVLTPQEKFTWMQMKGQIPVDATFKGETSDGKISYIVKTSSGGTMEVNSVPNLQGSDGFVQSTLPTTTQLIALNQPEMAAEQVQKEIDKNLADIKKLSEQNATEANIIRLRELMKNATVLNSLTPFLKAPTMSDEDLIKQYNERKLVIQGLPDFVRSFVQGTYGMYGTLGGALSWAGNEDYGEIFTTMSKITDDAFGVKEQKLYNNIVAAVPAMALFAALGLVTMAGTGAAMGGLAIRAAAVEGAKGILARAGVVALESLMTTAVLRPAESYMEAADVYNQSIAAGHTKEEASAAAVAVFNGNQNLAGLDAAQFALSYGGGAIMGKILPGGGVAKSSLLKYANKAGGLAVVGLSEGGEEVYQNSLQNMALGKNFSWTNWDDDTKTAFLVGAIMGGTQYIGGEVFGAKFDQKVKDKIKAETGVMPKDDAAVEKFIKENPKGQQFAADAANEVYKIYALEEIAKSKARVASGEARMTTAYEEKPSTTASTGKTELTQIKDDIAKIKSSNEVRLAQEARERQIAEDNAYRAKLQPSTNKIGMTAVEFDRYVATTKTNPSITPEQFRASQLAEYNALKAKYDAAKSNYETGAAYIKAVAASGNVYAGNTISQKQPEVNAYKAQVDQLSAQLQEYGIPDYANLTGVDLDTFLSQKAIKPELTVAEFNANNQKVVDARLAAEKKVADAKIAADKLKADEEQRIVNEKVAADAKVAAEKKAIEDKRIADAKIIEDKRIADEKAVADAKLKEEKAAADKKIADDKVLADKKAAEDKAKADKIAEEARLKAIADESTYRAKYQPAADKIGMKGVEFDRYINTTKTNPSVTPEQFRASQLVEYNTLKSQAAQYDATAKNNQAVVDYYNSMGNYSISGKFAGYVSSSKAQADAIRIQANAYALPDYASLTGNDLTEFLGKKAVNNALTVDAYIAEKQRVAAEKVAEENRIAAEKKAIEDKRIADIKAVEDKRIAEEKRVAEEKRIADTKIEEARLKEIADKKSADDKLAAETKAIEDAKLSAAEEAKQKKIAEDRAIEAKRIAEEKRIADEKKAITDKEVADKKAEEARLKEITDKKTAEEKAIADAKALEEKTAEAKRIKEEADKKAEDIRLQAIADANAYKAKYQPDADKIGMKGNEFDKFITTSKSNPSLTPAQFRASQLAEYNTLKTKFSAAKANYENGLAYIKAVNASGNPYAGNIISQRQPEFNAYKAQVDQLSAQLQGYDIPNYADMVGDELDRFLVANQTEPTLTPEQFRANEKEAEIKRLADIEAGKKAIENLRLAEEARVAEETKAKEAEEARLKSIEDIRLAKEVDDARLVEEARVAEEERLANIEAGKKAIEDARIVEEARIAEEIKAKEAEEARLKEVVIEPVEEVIPEEVPVEEPVIEEPIEEEPLVEEPPATEPEPQLQPEPEAGTVTPPQPQVQTVGAEELGMTEAQFARFKQLRETNPELTPEQFLENEQLILDDLNGGETKPIAIDDIERLAYKMDEAQYARFLTARENEPSLTPEQFLANEKAMWDNLEKVKQDQFQKTLDIIEEARLKEVARLEGKEAAVKEAAAAEEKRVANEKLATEKKAATEAKVKEKRLTELQKTTEEKRATEEKKAAEKRTEEKKRETGVPEEKTAVRPSSQPTPKRNPWFQNATETSTEVETEPAIKTETEVEAEVEPTTKTAVEEATETEAATKAAAKTELEEAVETAIQEEEATQLQDKTAVQEETEAQQETETQTETQTETETRAETRAATEAEVRTETKQAQIPRFPAIKLEIKGEEVGLSKEEFENLLAWRQGLFYKLAIPHAFIDGVPQYDQSDLRTTNKPVAGVPYAEGFMSAYRSFVAKGKKLPERIDLDMGAVDINITKVGDKLKLGFTRDTRYDITGPKKLRLIGGKRKKATTTTEERLVGLT